MDWTKLNLKEVIYYCKSFDVSFCCVPFNEQVEELVLMFHFYGIERFTVKDIQLPKIGLKDTMKSITRF